MAVREDAAVVLLFLANYEESPGDVKRGRYAFDGTELSEKSRLSPDRLNDAVNVLEDNGYVETMKFLDTAPYAFGQVELTSRGRVEAERIGSEPSVPGAGQSPSSAVAQSPIPVGSPYGFKDEDWEQVEHEHGDTSRMIVVLGHQWRSTCFNTDDLRRNIGEMFEKTLFRVLAKKKGAHVTLDYRPLQGGHGGHLFNEIARDIISADIAVFDTSDLNSNVMIELGVALTWGVRCLPVREASAAKPPSDISGQTWAEYESSGSVWKDSDHARKLEAMVERALRKKGVPLAR